MKAHRARVVFHEPESAKPSMAFNFVKERIDPCFPVVPTSDITYKGNFATVRFVHPIINEISGSGTVFA